MLSLEAHYLLVEHFLQSPKPPTPSAATEGALMSQWCITVDRVAVLVIGGFGGRMMRSTWVPKPEQVLMIHHSHHVQPPCFS